MLTKNDVNATLEQLSDKFTMDEFIDKLIFMEKVNNGSKDSKANRVNSLSETKEKLAKWLE